MNSNVGLYIDPNTLRVGIGTTVPRESMDVWGNMRLGGQIYNASNELIWVPGSTVEWRALPATPTLTMPSGGSWTATTSTGLYRYFGREIVYNPRMVGTVASPPSSSLADYLLSVPYPVDSNLYASPTLVGEMWMTVVYGGTSNAFKAYAQTLTGNYSNVSIRALTGTSDEALATILAGSVVILRGSMTYGAQYVGAVASVPTTAIPAKITQDQSGNVAVNTLNPARAQLDIIGSNMGLTPVPVLMADQVGNGDILQLKAGGTTEVIVDKQGNIGIGTTVATQPLHVVGNTRIIGNVGIGTTVATYPLTVMGNAYISGNVGIGTTLPRAGLDVIGIIRDANNSISQFRVSKTILNISSGGGSGSATINIFDYGVSNTALVYIEIKAMAYGSGASGSGFYIANVCGYSGHTISASLQPLNVITNTMVNGSWSLTNTVAGIYTLGLTNTAGSGLLKDSFVSFIVYYYNY
jgi:hypothetical protein